jgi:protocatechuate 3,4-dioxygenase beta subunit
MTDDKTRPFARRRFLGTAGLSLGAAALAQAFPAAAARCGVTGQTTAGPFYVAHAPAGVAINRLGARGTPMRIGGTVLSGDGLRSLAGVVVEIWHCDAAGNYHPDGSGDISGYPPEAVNLRGRAQTDGDGRFAFDSIVPGHYGNRRRHIHWKFAAEGHRPLTTQSYWQDERGSARERFDFVDRNVEACRWVRFQTGADGIVSGQFDVVLEALS